VSIFAIVFFSYRKVRKVFNKECKDSIFLPQRLQSFSQSSQ